MMKTLLLRCPVMPLETMSLDVMILGTFIMEILPGQDRYNAKLLGLKNSVFVSLASGISGTILYDRTTEVVEVLNGSESNVIPILGNVGFEDLIWISPQAVSYYKQLLFNPLIELSKLLELQLPVQ